MKTAIVYATKHGTTAHVAQKIKDRLDAANTDLFDLKNSANIDLSKYERVIVGGSVHAGTIQKRVSYFCKNHTLDLLQKPLGLFLCCMDEERAMQEFDTAFSELLRNHSKSKKIVGGEFLFDKMNFIEKFIIKKVSGVKASVSKIDESKIDEMVYEMKG